MTEHVNAPNEKGRSGGTIESAGRAGVVVGIDGSTESRRALEWALGYAVATGADVDAVAVWELPVQFADAGSLPGEEFEDEARAWLSEAVSALPEQDRARVRRSTERGDPADVLVHRARRSGLLVLGNPGRGAVANALLGSVVQRCAHRALCPVVLVPAPTH